MFNHFNQNITRAQSEKDDNYLLFIVNNTQLFIDCYIFNDVFYSSVWTQKSSKFRIIKTFYSMIVNLKL